MLCEDFSAVGVREAKVNDEVTAHSRCYLLFVNAFAQSATPKVGNKPLVEVKRKERMGCKLVGTVMGTKLWAGDCVGSELRGSTTTTQTHPCLSKRLGPAFLWSRRQTRKSVPPCSEGRSVTPSFAAVRIRKRRPLTSVSATKSSDQRGLAS